MAEVYGLVTARGGSKGVPGKNIKIVGGKPLIAWTIAAARQARRLDRVFLSTDDPEIAAVGREWGAEVPFMRPAKLAQDNSSHVSVVNHALDWFEANGGLPEYLCLLQPTSPLRTAADIDTAIEIALSRAANAVVAVAPAETHPFLTRKIEVDGTLVEFVKTDIKYLRRQDLPPAFIVNGAVYVNRCAAFRRTQLFIPPGTIAYMMPPERSIDIDTALDFVVVEHLLRERNVAV